MRPGKTVRVNATGEKYYLLSDCSKDGTVKAVRSKDKRLYALIKEWLVINPNRADQSFADEYEKELDIESLTPANEVIFITPFARLPFVVPDLGYVRVNGEVRQVNWIDETHFKWVDQPDVFTAQQFLEMMEDECWSIEKVG